MGGAQHFGQPCVADIGPSHQDIVADGFIEQGGIL